MRSFRAASFTLSDKTETILKGAIFSRDTNYFTLPGILITTLVDSPPIPLDHLSVSFCLLPY